MSVTIGINSFVRRQTPKSRFSHFAGNLQVIASEVVRNFGRAKRGYKDGVLLVPVHPEGFFCGVVEVTSETALRATFEARREGEEPYIVVEAVGGRKIPANAVDVVIYAHDVLGKDASTDADWEIVSLNARPTEDEEPMTPVAMARNFLELPGGTKAEYTAEQFAKAIIYWSWRAMVAEKK